ncbi:MAG: YdbL family protein [Candidatus Omnitrophica bacterium]|nr:YdbL family protein [Candidatus Omnitrophota bacterium]
MKAFGLSILILAAACSAVMAAGAYDIKEMTPAVQSALDGRKARYAELKSFKKQGAIGETSRGYVKALDASAGVREITEAENADRRVIYQAIVSQNELPGSELSTVEKVFAKVQRDKAESGEKVQDEDGQWGAK